MKTMSGQPSKEDQSLITVTVSRGAARLLYALLLTDNLSGRVDLAPDMLPRLVGVPSKHLQSCIDELIGAEEGSDFEGATVSDRPIVGPVGNIPIVSSIPSSKLESQDSSSAGGVDRAEQLCEDADVTGDVKAQALAVVEAWKELYPAVNKAQELRVAKAKEWVKLVSPAFPGHEASTVFGWMGGVAEEKLLGLDFPLGYVNKMVSNRAKELAPQQHDEQEVDGVMDGWRQYAKKVIEQGGNNGGKNIQGHLGRIVQAVKSGPGQSA